MRFQACIWMAGAALKLGGLCLTAAAKLNRRADIWMAKARRLTGGGGK